MLTIRTRIFASIIITASLALNGCAAPAKETGRGQVDHRPPVETTQPPPPPPVIRSPGLHASAPPQEAAHPLPAPIIGRITSADSLTPEFVEKRRTRYNVSFQQWLGAGTMETAGQLGVFTLNSWKHCADQLSRLYEGYSNAALAIQEGAAANDKDLLAEDIAFLESNCNAVLNAGLPLPAGRISGPIPLQLEALVSRQMKALNYEKAIATYDLLVRDFPDHPVAPAARQQYGMALLLSGQMPAALTHFQKTAAMQQQLSDMPWVRQRLLGDLYLAAGQHDKARETYQSLEKFQESLASDLEWGRQQIAFLDADSLSIFEKKAYSDLLLDSLTLDSMARASRLLDQIDRFNLTFPNSPAAHNIRQIKSMTEARLRSSTGKQLQQVDQLLEEDKFQQALTALEEMSPDSLPVGLYEIVQKSFDEVIMARARKEEAGRQEYERFLADRWRAAVNILDSSQYDLAITAFTSLLDTDHGAEARDKIATAAKQAATEKRKLAATLFIKAGKMTDPGQKKELLLASRDLLQEIIAKYPQVDIIDKVVQNLDIIDQQLHLLDPALPEAMEDGREGPPTAIDNLSL